MWSNKRELQDSVRKFLRATFPRHQSDRFVTIGLPLKTIASCIV